MPAGSLERTAWPPQRELLYIVDAASSVARGALVLELKTREPKLKGGWKKPGVPQISRAVLSVLPNPADRRILGLLSGSAMNSDWMSYSSYESIGAGFRMRHPFAATVMPDIVRTGRCLLQPNAAGQEWLPLVGTMASPGDWCSGCSARKAASGRWRGGCGAAAKRWICWRRC